MTSCLTLNAELSKNEDSLINTTPFSLSSFTIIERGLRTKIKYNTTEKASTDQHPVPHSRTSTLNLTLHPPTYPTHPSHTPLLSPSTHTHTRTRDNYTPPYYIILALIRISCIAFSVFFFKFKIYPILL